MRIGVLYPDGSLNVMAPPGDDHALLRAQTEMRRWNQTESKRDFAKVVSIDLEPGDVVVIE